MAHQEMYKLSFGLVPDPEAPLEEKKEAPLEEKKEASEDSEVAKDDEDDEGDEGDEDDEGDEGDEGDEDDEGDEGDEEPDPLLPPSSVLLAKYRKVRVFQIRSSDEHCIRIMDEFRHPNILRLESIKRSTEVTGEHTIFVQPYEGNLQTFICKRLKGDSGFDDIIHELQTIFRQSINGLSYLLEHNLHHAGFSLESTYFCIKEGEPVIKLANFKACPPKTIEVFGYKEVWTDDWCSVGKSIDDVVKMVIKHRANSFTGELEELARVLKDRSIDPLEMKERALEQAFFWTPEKRGAIFTCKVPILLEDVLFYKMASDSFGCPDGFGWGNNEYEGLVRIMNAYRLTIPRPEYTGQKKIQYLKFVSGSYAHEKELMNLYNLKRTVDSIFREYDAEMCLRLVKVVKAYEAEKSKVLQKGKK